METIELPSEVVDAAVAVLAEIGMDGHDGDPEIWRETVRVVDEGVFFAWRREHVREVRETPRGLAEVVVGMTQTPTEGLERAEALYADMRRRHPGMFQDRAIGYHIHGLWWTLDGRWLVSLGVGNGHIWTTQRDPVGLGGEWTERAQVLDDWETLTLRCPCEDLGERPLESIPGAVRQVRGEGHELHEWPCCHPLEAMPTAERVEAQLREVTRCVVGTMRGEDQCEGRLGLMRYEDEPDERPEP